MWVSGGLGLQVINSERPSTMLGSIPTWRVGITVFPVGDHTGALSANGLQRSRSRYSAPGWEALNRLNGVDECQVDRVQRWVRLFWLIFQHE